MGNQMTRKSKQVRRSVTSAPGHRVKLAIPILGLAGMGISGYLTAVHYLNVQATCLPFAECNPVLHSPYARIWGVPIALLGFFEYAFLTIMGIWLLREKSALQSPISAAIYSGALSGMIFTLYLYYLELFVIRAFCTWCIASSLVMTGILVLSLMNLFSAGLSLRGVSQLMRSRVRRYIQW